MLEVMAGPAEGGGAIVYGALADELLLASQRLGELAYDLGSDNETLRRHMTSLQSVDEVTQHLLVVADLLRAGADGDAIAKVPLADMAGRLQKALSDRPVSAPS